ncbi:uncharacterized protein BKA55DRAFT_516143 [Fusarium redolens]|uniref:Mitochondrial ATPase expression-domain-containing protein n=1 Tax=Fusarium redolens TaxID=48865 RepID=A0A9P9GRN1_FUSRE|nr:uncharacterized protein BKA55DRAFT_516143 [Fusarium redolens]KAH7244066.1 hypothetical protein BKA55DRAFT_516143 [Fusarium redolens]
MLWRQSLSRGTRLDYPSTTPLAFALRIYGSSLTHQRPAEVGRRRWLASISPPVSTSTSTFAQQRGRSLLDESSTYRTTPLDAFLKVIRCQETGRVLPAFQAWVKSLVNDDAEVANAALQELAGLPVATFSEILRALDPVANKYLDVAHDITISPGEMQFTNAHHLVDEFGVRYQHRFVLNALKILTKARRDAGRNLVLSDYEILIRCAGAAGDLADAVFFFSAITRHGLGPKRSTRTWNEFFKARYLTDPVYYQYHRQRVLYKPREGYKIFFRTPLDNVWRLESLRHSRNALRATPFNRQRHRVWADNMLWKRKKTGFQSYFAHWRRSKDTGVLLNEELLCTTLIAFARSGSFQHMRGIVLKRGFGIGLVEDKATGTFTVNGRKTFRPGNPRAPTERFLNAIVEAFGSMMRIRLACQLLIHVSNTYQIPIPRETWCNLLNWAYVCGVKSNQRQRRFMDFFPPSSKVTSSMVTEIWDTMTSEPYNVEPSFENYIVYINSLIFKHRFSEALDMIRDHAVPHYRHLEKQHLQTVFDDVLQEASEPSHSRRTVETQKEHAWYQIAKCLENLLSTASKDSRRRKGNFATTAVPHIVTEFSEFLHDQIRYRTSQGYVCLERSVDLPRFKWAKELRTTLPQLKGGLETQMMAASGAIEEAETYERRKENWPRNFEMKILEWRRKPQPRPRATGPAPEKTAVDAREWWKTLENELMV